MLKDDTIVYIKNEYSKRVRTTTGYYKRDIPISDCRVNTFSTYYFLCNFTTDKEFRNKGFATRVLKYIIRKADKPIELAVVKDNEVAMHLYEKLGFVEIHDDDDDDWDYAVIRMRYIKKKRYEKAIKHTSE